MSRSNIIDGKTFVDATGNGDVAAFSGVPFRVGASKVDEVVKEGLLEEGSLHEPGSMYRIGGVDFKRLLAFLKENPEIKEEIAQKIRDAAKGNVDEVAESEE